MVAEYIEREALLAAYDKAHVGPPGGARKLIAEAPAADVAPVVHGRWNGWHGDKMVAEDKYKHYHYYSCNKCGRKSAVASNYCPNCGARMDGE